MSLPSNAKKVFEWEIYDVYQREQKMFDGRREIFEKIIRPDNVFVIPVMEDGRILTIMQKQPHKNYWYSALIWWRIEKKHESPEHAIRSEMREEAWLQSDDLYVYKTIERKGKVSFTTYIYIARQCRKEHEPQPDPGGEIIELQYMHFDEFIDRMTGDEFSFPELQNIFLKIRLRNELLDFKKLLYENWSERG